MPRLAQPLGSEDAQEPVTILGNLVKASIVRALRQTPNVTMGPLSETLALPPTTLQPYLRELEAANIVIADPPMTEPRQRTPVRYRVNDEAVTDLYLRLGQAIGEI
ncbi:MAG TPA: winged helix-turn-helix domain-containing protein [Microbacterium sp.]|uniref:winged helix-turn-helix domain-containing protein n=1 Tax=Microbacterium sp. TaxID=51671 RepID=UPI002B483168|nr:winged helix-turn-helix domain-containing protein [Microbacterium sp.]HKT58179.1 winged helix-turn-helix domain-containing protein [Microbacterium sp.]